MSFLANHFENLQFCQKPNQKGGGPNKTHPAYIVAPLAQQAAETAIAGEADCPRYMQGVFCSFLRLSGWVFGKTANFQIELPKNSFALSFQNKCLRNQKTFRIPQNGIKRTFFVPPPSYFPERVSLTS